MKQLVQIVLGLVTLIGAFGLMFGRHDVHRLSADASAGDSSVWVYTPHVTPGDVITLGVGVYGGEDIAIEEIVVRDGSRELRVRGGGADWGSTISRSRTASDATDSTDVEVEVPRDARPGTTLQLVIEVRYAVARAGLQQGTFSNRSDADQLTVEVAVLTPAGATARRALAAGSALGLLGALCLLAWGMPRFERWVNRTELLGDGEMAALFLILAIVVNAMFIGHAVFALPLVAATGWTGTGFFVVACAVWTAAPLGAAWYGYRRGKDRPVLSPLEVRAVEGRPPVDPGDPYRAGPESDTAPLALVRRVAQTPVTLTALADALRAAGLTVVVKRKRIEVAGDDGKGPSTRLRVRDPERVTVDTLVFENRDMRAAFDVLHAALPALGPVELRLPVGNFLIDRRCTRDQLRADFEATFQAWIERLQRRLEPLALK